MGSRKVWRLPPLGPGAAAVMRFEHRLLQANCEPVLRIEEPHPQNESAGWRGTQLTIGLFLIADLLPTPAGFLAKPDCVVGNHPAHRVVQEEQGTRMFLDRPRDQFAPPSLVTKVVNFGFPDPPVS